jgi:ketosteroid isomerase-like protein
MSYGDSLGKLRLAVITAMAVGALLISPLWVSAQGTDPESVIRAIIDALNAKNIDAALALVADDAVVTIIPPPGDTTGVFTGKEEIRGWWEGYVAFGSHSEFSNFQVAGDKATWSAKVSADRLRAEGVASLGYKAEGIVQGGLLKSYTFTEREVAMATLPETGVPVASGVLFPTHALLVALGGLALLGGVVLALLRRLRRRGA